MSLATVFPRQPRLVVLTLSAIVVAGLSAYQTLPRREDPELKARFGTVVTRYPGADAADVEARVTKQLEVSLRELADIKRVYSRSRPEVSVVQFEFLDRIDDPTPAMNRVRAELQEAALSLPAGAFPPDLNDADFDAYTLIAALVWDREEAPQFALLARLSADLADRFRSLPGTAEVREFGRPREELLIELDADALFGLDLDVDRVAQRLAQAHADGPAGRLRDRGRNLLLDVTGEVDSLSRLREIPLVVRAEGGAVVVGDVGTVERSVSLPRTEQALPFGVDGVAIAVRMRSDQRIDRWSHEARELLSDWGRDLPPGFEVRVLFDQSGYVDLRLSRLLHNLLLGALSVAAVVCVFLGWRDAILVVAALPLTSLMVLFGLRLAGVPLHQMSFTGLVIALGLLIDNAIVVVDELRALMREGVAPLPAVERTLRSLAVPLMGSTTTTAFAFMPLLLMPGAGGDFVGAIAISVILALFSSLGLSLTILPALACWLRPREGGQGVLAHGLGSGWMQGPYRRLLRAAIARPTLAIAVGAAIPAIGFVMFRTLPEQFFPPTDRDQFQIQLELESHAGAPATRRKALAVRERLVELDSITDVHWFVGVSAPLFYYNLISGREGTESYAQAIVQLRPGVRSEPVIREVQRILDAEFAEVHMLALQLEQGPPFAAPVELRIQGPDLELLADLGDQARSVLAEIPDVVHTRSLLRADRPKLAIELDEADARLAGLSGSQVADALVASLDGRIAGIALEGTEELPVRVRLAANHRTSVPQIASLDMAALSFSAGSARVPLSGLADFHLERDLSEIPRRDGERLQTIQGYLRAGTLPSLVRDRFEAGLQQAGFVVPDGYSIQFGGEAEGRNDAVGNLLSSVLLLVVLMTATLVLSFGSFRCAALVALVGVLSVGAALFALWWFRQVFGFMAIIGTMGLVGVAINDSIVVIAALRADPAARRGDVAASVDVVVRATRHILATTFTTIAGFLPLILSGERFWPPMAIAIAGGVGGATLIALILVPSLHRRLVRGPVRAAAGPA